MSSPHPRLAEPVGLQLRLAQASECGAVHARNQDAHGASVPTALLRQSKGVVLAIADGIGSSASSHMASEVAVRSVLEDYYSTPESWSVKKSAQCVIAATNAWLYAQSRQAGHVGTRRDQACACTLSVLVLRSCTAHVFHAGDARIYRWRQGQLELLTRDHRAHIGEKSYLSRALGIEPSVELDYQSAPLCRGDVFALLTDGVHEWVGDAALRQALQQASAPDADLNACAADLLQQARAAGSRDDATLQIVQVQALPERSADDLHRFAGLLPCPPLLSVGQVIDGLVVCEQLHASSRSHVYRVAPQGAEADPSRHWVMKIPSLDGRQDPAHLERLLQEEWLASQMNSAHVLRSVTGHGSRSHLYVLSECVPGITLRAWVQENPEPSLDTVRAIVAQVARGLQAMHRRDILHRDLRPENILVDAEGRACIIDLGSAKAAGVHTLAELSEPEAGMGTLAFTAPEQFLGVPASLQSEQYALAAITYYLLSGRLPYGTRAARTRSAVEQARLRYTPVASAERDLPVWLDETLARALHPDPAQRFEALSEFVQGLRQAPSHWRGSSALMERHPLRFWQGLCVLLGLALLAALFALSLNR